MNQGTLDARWVVDRQVPEQIPAPVLFFEHKRKKKILSMLFP
jgi:hypothetical protein